MKIVIGADHGGFELKTRLIADLKASGQDPVDLGVYDLHSVDYPDFAVAASQSVMEGMAERGILICTTGIGMSISANRFPGVRAALCTEPAAAEKARRHNDANLLVLPGSLGPESAREILATWLQTEFSGAARHVRRLEKIEARAAGSVAMAPVLKTDPETWRILRDHARQEDASINLIASENNVSPAVRAAQGSVLTNKYAEGYPHKRWYNGCRFADEAESLAMERAKTLFGADHANVQPHCGSAANMAVYFSALQPGDTILAMSLAAGGHLTHGSPVNFSGRLFNIVSYGVSPEEEVIDYDALEALAVESRPSLIVAGASAYPRTLDFRRFREIADKVGARLMVDMAHIAGLVAGGAHPSPVPYAEYVTTTTHKTLRGPRSGMVLCREAFAKSIDKTVFPGLQGGPQVHVTAAKAVCFHEALRPAFKQYAADIVGNAAALAEGLAANGFRLVSGGTDNHLMLVDLTEKGLTGRDAANTLESIGIICNKNAIPFDRQSPFVTSGIRLGTPSVTTRGMGTRPMQRLAEWIAAALSDPGNESRLAALRAQVTELCQEYPVP